MTDRIGIGVGIRLCTSEGYSGAFLVPVASKPSGTHPKNNANKPKPRPTAGEVGEERTGRGGESEHGKVLQTTRQSRALP